MTNTNRDQPRLATSAKQLKMLRALFIVEFEKNPQMQSVDENTKQLLAEIAFPNEGDDDD